MRVVVLGAGISGQAAAELALRIGDEVTVYDANAQMGGDLPASLTFISGDWSELYLDGVDVLVTSPGIPPSAEPFSDARRKSVPIWSEIEYASRHLSAPMIAVTGTNGKTTVTSLIAEMASEAGLTAVAAGNIGLALSAIADQDWDVVVIEVSSFQLAFIDSFHPSVAVLLNIAEDHLDWHGSYTHYASSKARIFENFGDGDTLVFDLDDAGAAAVATQSSGKLIGVSATHLTDSGYGYHDGVLVMPGLSFGPEDRTVHDVAYLLDLGAAAAAAAAAGVDNEAIARVVRRFEPGEHRRELVLEHDGVRWINDSKATNPHAALAAIASYESVVLIAGGRNKDLDIAPLATAPTVRQLVAMGETAETLVRARGNGHFAASMREAVDIAREIAEEGDVVLLAPGCTSFDMFRDYQARGAAFRDLVRESVAP